MTERRSMVAERDTTDRYLAAYLADRVGSEFAGAITGVARFGLFVKLDETGADGLVPISSLGREYFAYDPDAQTLTGETSRRVLGLGQRVLVRLAEATPITGGLLFELLEVEGRRLPTPPRRAGKGTPRRKLSRSRSASARPNGPAEAVAPCRWLDCTRSLATETEVDRPEMRADPAWRWASIDQPRAVAPAALIVIGTSPSNTAVLRILRHGSLSSEGTRMDHRVYGLLRSSQRFSISGRQKIRRDRR